MPTIMEVNKNDEDCHAFDVLHETFHGLNEKIETTIVVNRINISRHISDAWIE